MGVETPPLVVLLVFKLPYNNFPNTTPYLNKCWTYLTHRCSPFLLSLPNIPGFRLSFFPREARPFVRQLQRVYHFLIHERRSLIGCHGLLPNPKHRGTCTAPVDQVNSLVSSLPSKVTKKMVWNWAASIWWMSVSQSKVLLGDN